MLAAGLSFAPRSLFMSYDWERPPSLWERYKTQIVAFCVTLAVGGIGAALAAWIAIHARY
jgi:hypothetical protein